MSETQKTQFKDGMYRFNATGTLYYLQSCGSEVLLWKGPTRKEALKHYCGARSLSFVATAFSAVQP